MAREFQKANHFNFNYGDPPNYHVFGYLNKHKHFMTFDFRWNDEAVRAEFVNFVLRKYNVVVINSNLLCQFVLYCIVLYVSAWTIPPRIQLLRLRRYIYFFSRQHFCGSCGLRQELLLWARENFYFRRTAPKKSFFEQWNEERTYQKWICSPSSEKDSSKSKECEINKLLLP